MRACTSASWSPADSSARPYQDPRVMHRAGDRRDHPRIQAAAAARRSRRACAVHRARAARRARTCRTRSSTRHSKLNCITACIQATKAGADEALMLDPHGFVATCNSTHFFIVRGGEVWTSSGKYCLAGITRANVLRAVPRERHPGVREELQPDRGVRRRRGLRDRHVRRRRAGASRSTGARSGRPRPDGASGCSELYRGADRARRRGSRRCA